MQLYQAELFQKHSKIVHAFTSRKDGNLAFHVKDDQQSVLNKHSQLAQTLHYKLQSLVHMKQIHSDIVHIVYANDNFDNPPTCDALITDRVDTPLMVMVADCSPILFFDSKQNVIAVAHAGRAGAFKNIVQKVLNSFLYDFHSNIEDIEVVIGPSILKCCYKIGAEIFQEAKELNLEYAIKERDSHLYLNISEILYTQLIDAGIEKKNIEISSICTRCNHQEYFSYRENNQTGRFAGIIYLKD